MSSDWSSTTFRNALCAMVRRRVPERDVEDVVQSTLVEALTAATKPGDPEAMRKWIWGIARNKVADYHRHAKRETLEASDEGSDAHASPNETQDGKHAVDDMLRWAMRELPDESESEQTLEWLLREGDGEKLEAIAESARIPAPRLRQRVSRLRRHLRTRWAADLAALAAIGIVGIIAILWWRHAHEEPIARPDVIFPVPPSALELAKKERADALDECTAHEWQKCLDGLDHAKEIDPAGDGAQNVQDARKLATDALTKDQPTKDEGPTPVAPMPSSSAAPIPTSNGKIPTLDSTPAPSGSATPNRTRPTSTSMPHRTSLTDDSSGMSSSPFPSDSSTAPTPSKPTRNTK